jgi:hypothetical protein
MTPPLRSIGKALRDMSVLRRPSKEDRRGIFERLAGAIARHDGYMTEVERQRLIRRLRVFAGTPLAGLLLSSEKALRAEVRQLGALLDAFQRTGVYVCEENERRLSRSQLAAWNGAVDEYYKTLAGPRQ